MTYEVIFILLGIPLGLLFAEQLTSFQIFLLGPSLWLFVVISGLASRKMKRLLSFQGDIPLKQIMGLLLDKEKPTLARFFAGICASAMVAGSMVVGSLLGILIFHVLKGR